MKRALWLAAALGLSITTTALAQQGPVPIFGLVELSGTGATSGTNFDNGVKLAVKEINASRRHPRPQDRIHVARHAVAAAGRQGAGAEGGRRQDAYVVMGPVFSGSILVSMAETRTRRDAQLHRRRSGGDHASRAIRTSSARRSRRSTAMPKVARYMKDTVKAKTVAIIWVNNDFGKGGRDTMKKALDAQGIKVVADISTDPGQLDFSGAVLKAKQANADALFVYTNEEESARALRELRKQGYDKPIVGETTLTSQKVIELAGDAANGATSRTSG